MVNKKISRTLNLRLAQGFTRLSPHETLQSLLRDIGNSCPLASDRKFSLEGKTIKAAHVLDNATGYYIHLVGVTPDEQVSTISRTDSVPALDLARANPPDGSDFTDGEAMFYVKGNDVICCKSGLPELTLVDYSAQLSARIGRHDVAYQLIKRANIDKIHLIQTEGVHKLSLNVAAHEASVDRLALVGRRGVGQRLIGKLLEEINALLHFDDGGTEDAENLKVKVTLSLNKRQRTEIDKEYIESLANFVLNTDDEDDFEIVTLTGRIIRPRDVSLSKIVRLRPFARSVSYNEVWQEMRTFYLELAQPLEGN